MLPPKRQRHVFFNHADSCQPEIGFPRWRCRENQFCHSRPRCRSHFFIARALGQSAKNGFLNPSNGILLVLLEVTLCVTPGGVDLCNRENRRSYFIRGVQKMNTDSMIFENH